MLSADTKLKSFTFSYYTTVAIVISFFPLYFDSLGFSKLQIGLILSSGPLIAIVANLFWGIMSDRLQKIKRIIIILLFGQLVIILLLSQSSTFGMILALMACFFFFQTPLNGLNDSQILLTIRSSGKSYASFRVMGSIGFATSAAMFGWFLTGKPSSIVAIITIFTIMISIFLSFSLTEARKGPQMAKIDFNGFKNVFFRRGLFIFLLFILMISTAHRCNDYFLALHMRNLGAGQDLIGMAWMTSALSEIPIFFLLSRYGERFNELLLLAIASFFYVIRFALLGVASSPSAIIGIQMLHSVTFGIFLFTTIQYLKKQIPDPFRATGQAVFSMIWGGFAGVLSGLIGGQLFDNFGGRAIFLFAAITAGIACIGFSVSFYLSKRSISASLISKLE